MRFGRPNELIPPTYLHNNVQSLALHPAGTFLAAVDAAQGLLVHRLSPAEDDATTPSYLPFAVPAGEDCGGEFAGCGWAGLALDPTRPEAIATVRGWSRLVDLTD